MEKSLCTDSFSSIFMADFVAMGHEIISAAILGLLLIQVGQFSVAGNRMCTKYWLTT